MDKSEACWIGTKRGAKETLINCRWVNLNCFVIRTLGIFNSYDMDLMENLNFLDKLKVLKDVLNLSEFRGLSLAGRILIFKSLAMSKLLYASTMKYLPKQMLDQSNTLQKCFIWSNRKPKSTHSTLIADYGEGGYKDIDI